MKKKLLKYVQDAMQECIDDPEPFNRRDYTVLIKYVPEADSICENHYELCCKHISGALLSIGYRMYELK